MKQPTLNCNLSHAVQHRSTGEWCQKLFKQFRSAYLNVPFLAFCAVYFVVMQMLSAYAQSMFLFRLSYASLIFVSVSMFADMFYSLKPNNHEQD